MISLKNISISFPVMNSNQIFLKNSILNSLIGGSLNHSNNITHIEALKNISLCINSGEKIALVGHNGSGKTTLLRLLSGVYPITTGEAKIQGSINSLIDIHLGINEEFTGRENVKIRSLIMGISKKNYKQFEEEVINFSELGYFIDMPIRTYSAGMKIRLAFAIATSVSSDILIMDEWLFTGDAKFQQKVNKRLSQNIDNSRIFIIATHNNDLILKNCNRAILLEKGKIIDDGNPKQILSSLS